jgi:pimeloyl-ACP methyl ester carboxylesterase
MFHRLLNAVILLPDAYRYQVPADLGLVAEEVAFLSAQGQSLKGLYFPSGGQAGMTGSMHGDAPVVLFCPGTSGNLSSHLYYIELLCRAGCTVLGLDYTGFGQSTGKAWLTTLLPDVLGAVDFLRQEKQVERLGIFGVSIGANIALLAAAQRPEIRAVALEGLSLYEEIVYGLLTEGIMGPRPVTALAYEGQPQAPRVPHVVNSWYVSRWLARGLARTGLAFFPFASKDPRQPARTLTDIPVLCIHGVEDPLLPFEGTVQVYEALPGARRLWLLPGVSHAQEPVLTQDGEYVAQLRDLFFGALTDAPVMPPVTCAVETNDGTTFGLQLRSPERPCLVLTAIMGPQCLDLRTVWVHHETYLPGVATGYRPTVSVLPLFMVEGAGETARVCYTARGQRYRTTFQLLVRELSRALHEGRWHELALLLRDLPVERPEAPFDFFLGLYCVQIMRRAQRKWPRLARIAAEAFCRYWHYGMAEGLATAPTPWDLASTVLGRPVSLQTVMHEQRRTEVG